MLLLCIYTHHFPIHFFTLWSMTFTFSDLKVFYQMIRNEFNYFPLFKLTKKQFSLSASMRNDEVFRSFFLLIRRSKKSYKIHFFNIFFTKNKHVIRSVARLRHHFSRKDIIFYTIQPCLQFIPAIVTI